MGWTIAERLWQIPGFLWIRNASSTASVTRATYNQAGTDNIRETNMLINSTNGADIQQTRRILVFMCTNPITINATCNQVPFKSRRDTSKVDKSRRFQSINQYLVPEDEKQSCRGLHIWRWHSGFMAYVYCKIEMWSQNSIWQREVRLAFLFHAQSFLTCYK